MGDHRVGINFPNAPTADVTNTEKIRCLQVEKILI